MCHKPTVRQQWRIVHLAHGDQSQQASGYEDIAVQPASISSLGPCCELNS